MCELIIKRLLASNSSHVQYIDKPLENFPQFELAMNNANIDIIYLDRHRIINNKIDLFTAMDVAFRFYWHSNYSWNSVLDQLRDSKYISSNGCLVYYEDASGLYKGDRQEFNSLVTYLSHAAGHWFNKNVYFKSLICLPL